MRSLSAELLDQKAHRDALARVNARHAETRRSMVRGEALARAEARLGADTVRRVLDSGITGLTPTKLNDVKCLHAPARRRIAVAGQRRRQRVLEGLEARGVDASGSDVCGEQCAGCAGGWRYTPRKNKQKLRTTRARHKKLRELSLAGYATSFGPARGGVAAARGGRRRR